LPFSQYSPAQHEPTPPSQNEPGDPHPPPSGMQLGSDTPQLSTPGPPQPVLVQH
jgi:hypothetical protein